MKAVTPCAGVWIEILEFIADQECTIVTPCAGVWIEILIKIPDCQRSAVNPCAGVWIEIWTCRFKNHTNLRHSLRGSVD